MNEERCIDRLDKYLKLKGLSDYVVTKTCHIAQGLIGQARNGAHDLGKKTIEKILIGYPDINRDWLYCGVGPMLNTTSPGVVNNDTEIHVNGNQGNIGSVGGDGSVQVSSNPTIEKLFAIIEKQQQTIERQQTIIEKLTAK